MAYVNQNVKTKKYLKHNGNYNPEAYQFKDVDTKEEAEQYLLKHMLITLACGMQIR